MGIERARSVGLDGWLLHRPVALALDPARFVALDRPPDTLCLSLQERIYPRGANGGPLLTFGEFLKRENAKAVLCGYNDSIRATAAGAGVCGARETPDSADHPASGASACVRTDDRAPSPAAGGAPSRLARTYAIVVHTPAGRLIDVLM